LPRAVRAWDDRCPMTLLQRLRDGDGAAFATLVDGNAASMLRVARMHVSSEAVAQEVVQETWLAVLQGLDYLEGALPERDRARLEAHLGECDECTIYLDQLRATMRLAGRVELDRLRPEARDALTQAFDAWVASR